MRDLPPNHLRCHQDGQLVGKMTDFHHFANHWLKLSGTERWKKIFGLLGFRQAPMAHGGGPIPPAGHPSSIAFLTSTCQRGFGPTPPQNAKVCRGSYREGGRV